MTDRKYSSLPPTSYDVLWQIGSTVVCREILSVHVWPQLECSAQKACHSISLYASSSFLIWNLDKTHRNSAAVNYLPPPHPGGIDSAGMKASLWYLCPTEFLFSFLLETSTGAVSPNHLSRPVLTFFFVRCGGWVGGRYFIIADMRSGVICNFKIR